MSSRAVPDIANESCEKNYNELSDQEFSQLLLDDSRSFIEHIKGCTTCQMRFDQLRRLDA